VSEQDFSRTLRLMVETDELRSTDLPAAAALLSRCHSGTAQWAGAESAVAHAQAAQQSIAASLPGALPVAARIQGELVGFLVAPMPVTPGARTANMALASHAAEPDVVREVYRALYMAVAGPLAQAGFLRHQVGVLVEPDSVVASWFQLGFGVDQIHGLQSLKTVTLSPNRVVETRRATADDLANLTDLAVESHQIPHPPAHVPFRTVPGPRHRPRARFVPGGSA